VTAPVAAALVLAGGLGTRLRSVTGERQPKAMVDVAGRPFLDYLLLQLACAHITRVCLLTGHGAAVVREHVGDGRRWGLVVSYSEEATPLGTAGALRAAIDRLDGHRFLVLNGDSFLDASLPVLIQAHAEGQRRAGVKATIALVRSDDAGRYGSVDVSNGAIVAFREKDPDAPPGLINAGVYVVERSLIADIPAGGPVSLENDVWPRYLDGQLHGLIVEGAFADIGIPAALERLRADPRPLLTLAGE
jgi:NDP-sugar pyrophosphorylase family protein